MLLETPETLADDYAVAKPVQAPEQPEAITVDEANQELTEVANEVAEIKAEAEGHEIPVEEFTKEQPASEISEEDRRFWAQCDVLGRIAECNRNIQASESVIDDYKSAIKEEKELLKGEQIRIQRLASELSDIIEGHPLPVDPNKKKAEESPKGEVNHSGDHVEPVEQDDNAWRSKPTRELLDGVKGLGAKKLDAIADAAPTAGHLEDLRGEASKAHQSFKEVLPKGCGQAMADEIEDRLIKLVAACSKSAEEQAAEERQKEIADAIPEREREEIAGRIGSEDDDGEYEDVE